MVGLPGLELDDSTQSLIQNHGINNFILFKRNVAGPQQLRSLCKALYSACLNQGLKPPLISIDQEGGTVTRLPPPFTQFPDASELARAVDRADVVRVVPYPTVRDAQRGPDGEVTHVPTAELAVAVEASVAAVGQLRGGLDDELTAVEQPLLALLARIEGALEFSDDEDMDTDAFILEYRGQLTDGLSLLASARHDDNSDFDDKTTGRLSAAWQATYDNDALHFRVVVQDSEHLQTKGIEELWDTLTAALERKLAAGR